eukprot:scaffold118742_cov24-Phaeocystis_antarctica.AAC.1
MLRLSDCGLRACPSSTWCDSASGSSPVPLRLKLYLSPVVWLVRVSSPTRSHTHCGVKSSG